VKGGDTRRTLIVQWREKCIQNVVVIDVLSTVIANNYNFWDMTLRHTSKTIDVSEEHAFVFSVCK
jgi:hypothetical protein